MSAFRVDILTNFAHICTHTHSDSHSNFCVFLFRLTMYDILSYLNHRIRVQETFCAVINFRNANIYQPDWTDPLTLCWAWGSTLPAGIHFQAQLLLFSLTDFVMSLDRDLVFGSSFCLRLYFLSLCRLARVE